MHTRSPLLFSLILACAPLAAQEKFTLRYQFEPGKTTWLLQTQEQTMNMNMGGREMKTQMTSATWIEGRVGEVKNGTASIEQRYARVKAKSDSPMINLDYDSDVEGSKAGPMASLAALVGKKATMRVDEMGKVVEIKMPEGAADQMEKVTASMKQGFERQLTAWPKDPIAIGDSWKTNLDFPIERMGTMKATITNKLIAVKDNVVTVEQTMQMDTSGLTMQGGLKMEVTKASGTSKFSLKSPMPIESNTTMEMKMVGSEEMPVDMTMSQVMAMKQVEAPAPKKPAEATKTGDGK